MTVRELAEKGIFKAVNIPAEAEREITSVFCCDLLSVAMGRAPAGCAWVTVMGNVNTIAVATLADAAVVILAENAALDENAAEKAAQQGVSVLASEMPIFDAALKVHELLKP